MHRPPRPRPRRRGGLSWPAAALPPLLLVGLLAGGSAAGLAPSSGRVVDITVTSGP